MEREKQWNDPFMVPSHLSRASAASKQTQRPELVQPSPPSVSLASDSPAVHHSLRILRKTLLGLDQVPNIICRRTCHCLAFDLILTSNDTALLSMRRLVEVSWPFEVYRCKGSWCCGGDVPTTGSDNADAPAGSKRSSTQN